MPLYGEGPLVALCVVGAAVDSALLCGREISVAVGKNLICNKQLVTFARKSIQAMRCTFAREW